QARVEHFADRVHLVFENIMRPFGLPVASGLVSAIALFALLAPSLSFAHHGGSETPTRIATYPQLEHVGGVPDLPTMEDPDDFGSNSEVILELKISPLGKVWDWTVLQAPTGMTDLTPDLKQMILLAQFTPATVFGKPTWGRVRI